MGYQIAKYRLSGLEISDFGVYSWIYEFVIRALVITDCEYFVSFYDKSGFIDPPPTPQETTSVFSIKNMLNEYDRCRIAKAWHV